MKCVRKFKHTLRDRPMLVHGLVQPHCRFLLEFFVAPQDRGKFVGIKMSLWLIELSTMETRNQCKPESIDHLKM